MRTMSFDVEIGHASHRGPRSHNEDFAGAVRAPKAEGSRGLVAAVADGVSTGGLGLEAAQTTVMGLLADYFATPATWEPTVVLDRLIRAQNAWLADHNRRRAGQGTALTTLTALALHGQTWTLAHVGDTRAWLLRPGPQGLEMSQLTQDHAYDHPDQRSRLTRAVGLDDVVRVDFLQGELRAGDLLVLSTDGVHGALRPDRLAKLMAEPAAGNGAPDAGAAVDAQDATGTSADTPPGTHSNAAQALADRLVQAALDAGGQDNATALVIRVRGVDTRRLQDELADLARLPPPRALRVGESLDGYTITARVADTGAHLLYQARERSGALVAIKALHPSRHGDPQEREMLAHEAWLGQRISEGGTRGFVRVHPRRPEASAAYVVFDWHHGRTLQQMMALGRPSRGGVHGGVSTERPSDASTGTRESAPPTTDLRPPVADAIAAALDWARALGRLHRQGVIHRDIKPGNLHLGDDGVWRVLDLGAALSGREGEASRLLHAGTPSYMNPEQWLAGGQASPGSDLFALGVTLYQWLTGRLPYGEVEPWQRGAYRRDPVPASRLRPDLPIWLEHLLAKAISRDATQRFETAEELVLALERGASRPLPAPGNTPLLKRDPAAALKLALGLSLLLNGLLLAWLWMTPR